MAPTTFVRARIDTETRDQAADILAEIGLTVSDVLRMTLTRVARERALPLELKVPNAETRAAMDEARAAMKARAARFQNPDALFDALDAKER